VPGKFEQRVAFVTGAARGLGLHIAADLARDGALVSISDLEEPAVEAAAASLRAAGGQAIGVCCDVTREAEIDAAIARTVDRWGKIDILVNNAGLQFVSPLEQFPSERFEHLLRVMLIAPFLLTKRVFPLMKSARYGRILNMASINGLVGFAGKAAYNSAKHGLIGLTRVAALEGATYGITVNALCPGYTDTQMVQGQLTDLARARGVPLERVLEDVIFPLVPMRRLLTQEEVSAYALFLLSEEASGVTGQAAVVDGGYTAQ
jgi:3-hydroxybutyrate dehydrogenase